ncbi:hypothetical protein niasHS_011666 [Heterodera schachtii]|uniref:Thiaminase-2/PQQC domain-containing protein n=1 Tax=Heterodera schachtii TaxID=97005 RepID=A0ABD2ITH5_HETSC
MDKTMATEIGETMHERPSLDTSRAINSVKNWPGPPKSMNLTLQEGSLEKWRYCIATVFAENVRVLTSVAFLPLMTTGQQPPSLLLINAVYFNGNWANKFNPKLMKKKIFYVDEINTKEQSLPVIVASMLPCYWLYREVAKWMLAERQKAGDTNTVTHQYHEWIDMYCSEEYAEAVDEMLALADELAQEADQRTRVKMASVFERGFQLEWMFWKSAYHGPMGNLIFTRFVLIWRAQI